jgi:hypothetical protein
MARECGHSFATHSLALIAGLFTQPKDGKHNHPSWTMACWSLNDSSRVKELFGAEYLTD